MTTAVQSASDVLKQDRFGRIVTDAARASQKDHGCGNARGEDHGVVACSARHAMRRASGGTDCRLDLPHKKRIHSDSRLVKEGREIRRESAASCNLMSEGSQ